MRRHVEVKHLAGADFHDDEDVKHAKAGGDYVEEIRSDDRFCVIPTNVAQRCDELRRSGPLSSRIGMYFRTVRGETRMPSLTRSSWAILSSPHVMFATAISALDCVRPAGS